jgi:hypothetical protein
MTDAAIWLFIVIVFGDPIAMLLKPSLLKAPSFRFALSAAQAGCAVALYFWLLGRGTVWFGIAILLMVAFYNLWVGLHLRKEKKD